MRKMIFAFIGKKKDLQAQLAAAVAREAKSGTGRSNVIYLQKCELCGRLAKGDFCKRCEPLFRRWTKKVATELAAEREKTNPIDPIIA